MNPLAQYKNPRLIRYDDPTYYAYLNRLREQRPPRTGRRHAGEYLGGLAERCARHWLEKSVPLQDERILAWEQRLRNNRMGTLYREIDGVWRIDAESLCLFEIKFTYLERMEGAAGLKQLDASSSMLSLDPAYRYLLLRLVYLSDEPVPVWVGDEELPVVEPNDEYTELGVVWVSLDTVQEMAQELELTLPDNWREPEAREGDLETAEDEEWKQYAEQAEAETFSPLEEALRRAMNKETS